MIMDVNLSSDQKFNVQFMETGSTFDTNISTPSGGTGENGLSAYEIAVKNGFRGTETEWLASLVGPEGPEGPKGEDGKTPQKGVDYWTGDDKAEMVNDILNALQHAEGVKF